MRKILFRGKSKKTGEWIFGYYLKNRGVDFIAPDEFANGKTWEDYEILPETVCQFTGLYDKNGKEIYEGDILKFFDEDIPYSVVAVFEDNQFKLVYRRMPYLTCSWPADDMELIGNVHERKKNKL